MATKRTEPDTARILEVGSHAIMKMAFPDRTTLLWAYHKLQEPIEFYVPFSFKTAWNAWRDIRNGKFDLIVLWVEPYAPWNFRRLKGVVSRPFHPLSSLFRIFAVQMFRFVSTATPIVAIDNEDSRMIARHNVFLLDKVKYFFKRELPVDRWQVFQYSVHAGLPGFRFRTKPKNRRRVEKLRPISIGVVMTESEAQQFSLPEKVTDVFAALTLEGGTTVRNEGIRQLRALAKEGVVVDIPNERLPPIEFRKRMSQSWLTWSPEGLGWDCFRHYEAPLAGSIPVINRPTIIRYAPMIDGVHAIYYEPDESKSLGDRIKAALGDKIRLREMIEQARAHVLKHHMRPRPFADAIVRMGLGYEDAPAGVVLD
jgi:hypothetical protein